jgi:hypothetical protein
VQPGCSSCVSTSLNINTMNLPGVQKHIHNVSIKLGVIALQPLKTIWIQTLAGRLYVYESPEERRVNGNEEKLRGLIRRRDRRRTWMSIPKTHAHANRYALCTHTHPHRSGCVERSGMITHITLGRQPNGLPVLTYTER